MVPASRQAMPQRAASKLASEIESTLRVPEEITVVGTGNVKGLIAHGAEPPPPPTPPLAVDPAALLDPAAGLVLVEPPEPVVPVPLEVCEPVDAPAFVDVIPEVAVTESPPPMPPIPTVTVPEVLTLDAPPMEVAGPSATWRSPMPAMSSHPARATSATAPKTVPPFPLSLPQKRIGGDANRMTPPHTIVPRSLALHRRVTGGRSPQLRVPQKDLLGFGDAETSKDARG
jgi:hypothetical protein